MRSYLITILDKDGPSCAYCAVDDPSVWGDAERVAFAQIMARWA